VSPVSIAAAAEEKNKDNNKENEHHKGVRWVGYLFFCCGRRFGCFFFG
jgi:hypothetical protein